jgi:hypothetical protein
MISFQGPQKNFYEKGNDELYALVLPFNKFNIEYLCASKGFVQFQFIE